MATLPDLDLKAGKAIKADLKKEKENNHQQPLLNHNEEQEEKKRPSKISKSDDAEGRNQKVESFSKGETSEDQKTGDGDTEDSDSRISVIRVPPPTHLLRNIIEEPRNRLPFWP